MHRITSVEFVFENGKYDHVNIDYAQAQPQLPPMQLGKLALHSGNTSPVIGEKYLSSAPS